VPLPQNSSELQKISAAVLARYERQGGSFRAGTAVNALVRQRASSCANPGHFSERGRLRKAVPERHEPGRNRAQSRDAPLNDSDYQPGQLWTYVGAQFAESRVVVGRVDHFTGEPGCVLSISVTPVAFPTEEGGSRISAISHVPISKSALDVSVIAHTGTGVPVEGFEAVYEDWRGAMTAGKGGVFSVGVAEIVDLLGQALLKGR
jgi:hypothetical protein